MSDAVVNPWAMMIKSINAFIAVVAVIRLTRSNNFAFWAYVCWLEVLV